MRKYYQLTECQRYQIYALKKVGHDQQTIAATLAVSRWSAGNCAAIVANAATVPAQHALTRRQQKAQVTKMTPEVVERIEADLRQEWSPEQIAGRLAAQGGLRLSPERIYQHIRADRQAGGTLYRHLRHRQKKRKKRYGKPDARGQIKDQTRIDQRPTVVEGKSRIGDGAIDRVMGGKGQGALVSLVERRSSYTLLGKVASKQAEEVASPLRCSPLTRSIPRPLRPITARSLPTIQRSARRWTRPSISLIPTMPGNGASTRIPTG